MNSTIKKWRSYFEKKGVLVDVGYAKFIMADIRKKSRERRKLGLEESHLYKYRKSMVEDMFTSSSEYLNGEFLEVRGFINELGGGKILLNSEYNITPTYRLISKNPSIGNLDDYLRRLIVPRNGYYIVSIDFKHQEPWIIVNLLENRELMDILTHHEDFYLGILDNFNVSLNNENRDKVKKVWNASIYGSSLDNLIDDDSMWIEDVYNWINHNNAVVKLRKKVEKNLKENKEIYTRFGLTRSIPYDGDKSIRQAFNSIFQMSGAGVMYTGLENIHNAVNHKGFGNKIDIYFTNHDEFILEVSEELSIDDITTFLKSISFEIDGWTKPRFEIKIGRNWGDVE